MVVAGRPVIAGIPPPEAADQVADGDGGQFRAVPVRGDRGDLHEHARATVRPDMQSEFGRTAGQSTAQIDEIAIALGARADHGIGEDNGVRFAPGDLRALTRAVSGLIGCAGECRETAEREMGLHQALAVGAQLRRRRETIRDG